MPIATPSPKPAPRIAILVHSMNDGGAQKRLASLANGFATRGHAVDLVAVSGAGDVGRLLSPEVRRIVLGASGKRTPRLVAGVGPLKAYLERERPAVLLAGTNRAHVVAALACAGLARPPLLVLRAARHPLRHLPWSRPVKRLREYALRPIERWAYGRANLVIAVSRESAAAIGALVADPQKVVVIPNPTITANFRAALGTRVEHRWFDETAAGGAPVILGVGRLSPQKDFETLVAALAIVRRSTPARLIILGEGKRRESVEAAIARHGLADAVDLIGHVDGVGGWLAGADLLVSSSLWEGSPGAIIEAFEAGLPVVATACPGGSVELIEGSSAGLLVPMRDAAAMAAAIVTMLARPRDRNAVRALALPYQDDGRADRHYLDEITLALEAHEQATAAPGRAPPFLGL